MTTAVIDLDWIRYAAGFVGEKREIQAIHKSSGDVRTFKNVTEFYGRGKAKNKGWIGKWNEEHPDNQITSDDFEIMEIQKPEPIANVLHTAKKMLEGALRSVNADDFIGYYGKGDSFRVERSTMLKYKGNREHLKKPLLIDDITHYLEKQWGAICVEGLEADDHCIISAYRKKDHIVVSPDKDTAGCEVLWANPMKEFEILDCSGFGRLWLENEGTDKEKVRGVGRLFFYYQVAYGDDVDNYRANAASATPWGSKSAYVNMADCKNDQEALEALMRIYQHLYPETVTIEGWRGDIIEVDWLYAMTEVFDLARMLRWEDDVVHLPNVLGKYKLL